MKRRRSRRRKRRRMEDSNQFCYLSRQRKTKADLKDAEKNKPHTKPPHIAALARFFFIQCKLLPKSIIANLGFTFQCKANKKYYSKKV